MGRATTPRAERRGAAGRRGAAARHGRRLGDTLRAAVLVPALLLALAAHAAGAGTGTVVHGRTAPVEAGTPAIAYSVYLPADPDGAPGPFPVLYLLHGFGASPEEWLDAAALPGILDRLIADRRIAPVIAVMPDAARSWYVDSARHGGPGDYETAIVRDLVRAVDARYPTRATPRGRAVAGVSMGGFGALRLAFGHPDVFGAVVALSPGLFKPGGLSWRHGPAAARRANREHWYARTFGDPFDMDLYTARSPFAYVDRVAGATPPPEIMLVVGDDDVFHAHDGTLEMYLDLRAAGLKPELRVADGGHDWRFWRAMLPEVLRFVDSCWADGAVAAHGGG